MDKTSIAKTSLCGMQKTNCRWTWKPVISFPSQCNHICFKANGWSEFKTRLRQSLWQNRDGSGEWVITAWILSLLDWLLLEVGPSIFPILLFAHGLNNPGFELIPSIYFYVNVSKLGWKQNGNLNLRISCFEMFVPRSPEQDFESQNAASGRQRWLVYFQGISTTTHLSHFLIKVSAYCERRRKL